MGKQPLNTQNAWVKAFKDHRELLETATWADDGPYAMQLEIKNRYTFLTEICGFVKKVFDNMGYRSFFSVKATCCGNKITE